ncbi:MAG: hypothetical protein KY459_11115 [Acidobacteria bacterium]|nr:hypothetical protein [Acidobacteriota bacterium]
MRNRTSILLAATLPLLFLGCGSTDLGGILGGGTDTRTSSSAPSMVRGVVSSVDPTNRVIYLDSATVSLQNSGYDSAKLYYETNTPVIFNNERYTPENLERGDRIEASVQSSSNRLIATEIHVTYDSTPDDAWGGSTNASLMTGTVRDIDTRSRWIDVQSNDWNRTVTRVYYDNSTVAMQDGRSYNPDTIRVGDEIRLEVSQTSNRLYASRIEIGATASGGDRWGSINETVRAEVVSVNEWNNTLEVRRTTGARERLTLSYDSRTGVEYQGRTYPVVNLERGDVVDIAVTGTSPTNLTASRIVVVRSVR